MLKSAAVNLAVGSIDEIQIIKFGERQSVKNNNSQRKVKLEAWLFLKTKSQQEICAIDSLERDYFSSFAVERKRDFLLGKAEINSRYTDSLIDEFGR